MHRNRGMRKILVIAVVFALSMTAGVVVYRFGFFAKPPDIASITRSAVTKPMLGFKAFAHPRPLKHFQFVDGDWKAVSLGDFRGKVVLLNLWATWCAPCREEMPALDRLQARLGGQDFEVVALSIDQEGVAVVKHFYHELDLKALRVFVDPTGRAPIHLDALGVPTTLFIDHTGQEIARYAGPAEWDSPELMKVIRGILDGAVASDGERGRQ
ncbi:MAG: TlpA family protein disulfide reductase [Acidiferrobacterales bacterium]